MEILIHGSEESFAPTVERFAPITGSYERIAAISEWTPESDALTFVNTVATGAMMHRKENCVPIAGKSWQTRVGSIRTSVKSESTDVIAEEMRATYIAICDGREETN